MPCSATGADSKSVARTRDISSKRASSRKVRVYAFRSFLLKTYPEQLTLGSSLLDVAGGKGDLSWILLNVDGLNPIVCDPRVTKHTHLLRGVSFLLENPEEAAFRAEPGRDTHQPLAALIPKLREFCDNEGEFKEPSHLRIHVDSNLVEAITDALSQLGNGSDVFTSSPSSWENYWENATANAEAATPLGHREFDDDTTGRISDSLSALRAILGTTLIVGFHPDQATEACVDLALVLRVPFAVVPCCVFPSEFPSRRTEDGERVKRYAEFIAYLHRKVPFVRSEALNFHKTPANAKNVVLFTLPEDVPMYRSVLEG